MRFRGQAILLGLFLSLIHVNAGALDYKDWIQLLPETVGGLSRHGKPDGMNMETGDMKWSSVHQNYGDPNAEKHIELVLMVGKSPQMASYKMMPKMKMETEEQIVKTVAVKKYEAFLNLEKTEKRGTLMISLGEEIMTVINAAPITREEEIIRLAEELPLDKFAAHVK